MKSVIKTMAALGIGALSLIITTKSDAQIRFYGSHPRVSIGLGLGYYPGINYYYNPYGGYYGYTYPRVGFSLGYLPYGYLPFYYGSDLYYMNNGVYYRQFDDHNYQVVAPPVGAEVPRLPSHAHSILIDNQQYFELSGVYYKPNVKVDGSRDYLIAGKDGVLSTNVVAAPPVNAQQQPAPMPQNYQPAPTPQNSQVAPPDTYNQPQQQTPAPPTNAPAYKTGDTVTQLPDGCKAVTVAGKKYFVSAGDVYFEEFNNNGKVGYHVAGTPADQQ